MRFKEDADSRRLHRSLHPRHEADCLRNNPPLQVRVRAAEVHLTDGFQMHFFLTSICPADAFSPLAHLASVSLKLPV